MLQLPHIDARYTGGVKMLSEHAKGRACDINQEKRNVVSVRQPKNVRDVAHKCGLFSGAEWASTPDRGHFEVLDGLTPTPPPHWPMTLATYKEKPHYPRDSIHMKGACRRGSAGVC